MTTPEAPAFWAERLARSRLRLVMVLDALPAEHIAPALDLLWSLIEEAVGQANAALTRWGLAERIVVRRHTGQSWIGITDPDGRERRISVFEGVHARDGQVSGGVVITTSVCRSAVYLVPARTGGQVQWWLPDIGIPFTAAMVHDLFLSVFSDDPVAAG